MYIFFITVQFLSPNVYTECIVWGRRGFEILINKVYGSNLTSCAVLSIYAYIWGDKQQTKVFFPDDLLSFVVASYILLCMFVCLFVYLFIFSFCIFSFFIQILVILCFQPHDFRIICEFVYKRSTSLWCSSC